MTNLVSQAFSELVPDAWRNEIGFSPEIESANNLLFASELSEAECASIINDWIQKHQPCLFGKIAAKFGKITYCILKESDLERSDAFLTEKIQAFRTEWTREGFNGKKSGFIILVISPRVSSAVPNEAMMRLANRLCSLYLLEETSVDKIYQEEIFLEKPGPERTTWKWNAGVNYFSTHGDKRWWQDHRIPGGMAFSINSVGHMVKSGMLAGAMKELNALLGAPEEGWESTRVDSPEDALQYAMLTIDNASDAISGKATELLPLPANLNELPVHECPIKLPKIIQDKNFCEYKGQYHTDFTLPSEYFLPAIERPVDLQTHLLDFTYLIDKHIDNPDFLRLLQGQQIRGAGSNLMQKIELAKTKQGIAVEQTVNVEDNDRLKKALIS